MEMIKYRFFLCILCVIFFIVSCSQALFGQERSTDIVLVRDSTGADVTAYDGSYALVIGVSKYSKGWDQLPGVVSDVDSVTAVLLEHNFVVEKLLNPDRANFIKELEEFINTAGNSNPASRLLIYFAGHGVTLNNNWGGETGYIVPSDAPPPEEVENLRAVAISLDDMINYAKKIQAKHALFVFDSCFSGQLFTTMRGPSIPSYILEKTGPPVRQFITSGSASEQVPDKSIFRKYFVNALRGAQGALGNDNYLSGVELGEYLKRNVITASTEFGRSQTPQYGKINDSNLNKGDYVFVFPDKEVKEDVEEGGVFQVLEDANLAQLAMRDAKKSASAAHAERYGTEEFQRGMQHEEMGNQAIQKNGIESYKLAKKLYVWAMNSYDAARVKSLERRTFIVDASEAIGLAFKAIFEEQETKKLDSIFLNLDVETKKTYLTLSEEDIIQVYIGWDNWEHIGQEELKADVMVDIDYRDLRGRLVRLQHLYTWTFKKIDSEWRITEYE